MTLVAGDASLVSVSVVTICYNQDKYIKQALESIVAQKTSFKFEVIVADDASSDSTQQIIKDYEKRHPGIFNNILRKKNIGAINNVRDALGRAQGKYIALCEGDDFWEDTSKLQQQFDFLEKNSDHALCFHPVRVFFENGEEEELIFPDRKNNFTTEELLKKNFIQTNSVMYRAMSDYSGLVNDVMPYDWYLHLSHAQYGKIGFIDSSMSAYRRHAEGIWWQTSSAGDLNRVWKKHGIGHLRLYMEMFYIYGRHKAHRAAILENITSSLAVFKQIDSKGDSKSELLSEALLRLSESPEALRLSIEKIINDNLNTVTQLKEELQYKEQEFSKKNKELENINRALGAQIAEIKNSKRYKFAERIANMKP